MDGDRGGPSLTRRPSVQIHDRDSHIHRHRDEESSCPRDVDNFVAGALSGLVTNCVLHPLDTLSARLKVQSSTHGFIGTTRTILKTEGATALYYGIGATFLSCLPTDAIYFCAYEICKRQGEKHSSVPTPLVHFVSGGLAEIACSIIYNPFEVVKTRMQMGSNVHKTAVDWVQSSLPAGNYRHTPHAFATIIRTEGFRGLFAGYGANIATGCGLSAVQFMLYEQFKVAMQKLKDAKIEMSADKDLDALIPLMPVRRDDAGLPLLRTRETIVAGAMAGAIAGFVTNPLDLVGTRMMVRGSGGLRENSSTLLSSMPATAGGGGYRECIRHLFRQEGVVGFFRGAWPRVLWCSPFSAISFAVYERARVWLSSRG